MGGPWRLGSAVPAIDALSYIGNWRPTQTTRDWKNDPYLNRNHSLYQFARKLTHIRRSCSALRHGSIVWHRADPQVGGLLIFSRYQSSTMREIVVIINPAKHAATTGSIPVQNNSAKKPNQVWVNLVNGFNKATIGYDSSGNCFLFLPPAFHIAPQSFLIFANADEVSGYDSYLDTMLCNDQ